MVGETLSKNRLRTLKSTADTTRSACAAAACAVLAAFLFCAAAHAQDRPLRICTQNIHRLGEPPEAGRHRPKKKDQERELIERMAGAECDVAALQEVYGETAAEAQSLADSLASSLSAHTGRRFKAYIAESSDPRIRNGFLAAVDCARVRSMRSFLDHPLPKFYPWGSPGSFNRAPLALVLELNGGGRAVLITMHFKSKADAYKDPSGTAFELLRMQMAAGLLEIAEELRREAGPQAPIVILGDRNSDRGTGAAEILSGERSLGDFTKGGGCRLTAGEKPDCKSAGRKIRFVGLLEECARGDRSYCRGGSYRYKGQPLLLDEIMVSAEHLDRFQRADGSPAVGFRGRFHRGSDHRLLWAEMKR